uniref:Ubiquinone biosynthesis O-methyltransferase, mitochondrial n=1 Tax=Kryptolebias marmoratus TaxID=37003 RepID=A0A3Q2ZYY2_KRYMA
MSSSKWVRLMFGPFGLKPSSVCGVVRGPAGRSSFSWTAVCRHVSVCSARSASYTTVDPGEVKRFQALANKWWDEQGEFAALHAMNDLRVPFVRDNLLTVHRAHHPGKPLAGLRILDVGCGGGVFTEPLGRLGASVLGIDPVEESISVAQLHSSPDPDLRDRVSYHACTLDEAQFDAVVASEVVEHLADLETFAICCNHVLKPGGSLFITTINKTNLSYALAIVIAEQLLRIVPSGTHDWEKFISPVELERLLESNGFSVQSVQGMMYNPVSGAWSWSDSTAINYALHAVKTSDGAEESCTHSVNEPATTHSSAPS